MVSFEMKYNSIFESLKASAPFYNSGNDFMDTKILSLDPKNFDKLELKYAAELLRKGELVAFPTETVYGLGANALDGSAVKKIFQAKGRPADNPLIVHICSLEMLDTLVEDISEKERSLMKKYWPGPMTLIFRRKEMVPNVVTANLDTVAIRMPSHPIALALIEAAGVPIAAPSANRSGKTSPTKAEHVYEDMKGLIPLILDGGQCTGGLESTVIDLHKNPPLILRPGMLTLETLRQDLPTIQYYSAESDHGELEKKPSTPGMKYKHYSPETPLILFIGTEKEIASKIEQFLHGSTQKSFKILLASATTQIKLEKMNGKSIEIQCLSTSESKKDVARNLFAALRESDHQNFDLILVQGVPENEEGKAIMNRLRKAAKQII